MGRPRGPQLPRPPSAAQARKAFREALLEREGTFISVEHFKERMLERRFDLNDVGHVARTGRIHGEKTVKAITIETPGR